MLTEDLVIGAEFGGGVQGAVYDLLKADGTSANKLLKVIKYKEATPVTGMDVTLQREWLIGQQINMLAAGPDEPIPGAKPASGRLAVFLVCDCRP
jgi:hypothetical protein